ncbi:MAG TPA: TIM-barrel domain-containing protein [Vicinamibacterales bacterium]|nr:TIM-barrel domain-containing protein [Vicinamibacterales bacterium]
MTRRSLFAALGAGLLAASAIRLDAQPGTRPPRLLNDPVDVAADFHDYRHAYYIADALASFDPATGEGTIRWVRHHRYPRLAFNNMETVLRRFEGVVFPEREYPADPVLPFAITFVSPRAVRLRVWTGPRTEAAEPSLMLAGDPPADRSWRHEAIAGGHRYTGAAGSVTIREKPWRIEIRDAQGRLLTQTQHPTDFATTLYSALPFSFVRRASDYSRSVAAVLALAPGERIYGGGESFGRLDKVGQRLVLWVKDAHGAESERMYKPVPFLLSSRGYGLFAHTSAPATFDVGATFHGSNALLLGDDTLDLFVFLGAPKDVLGEYTALTGRAPMPPLWSFGFWMSRITYTSEDEVRAVAAALRRHRIPSDVIHIDTGWFETDWRCDYEFSKTRFRDPARMIADLRRDGFRISLWQLPYFTPANRLFPEIVARGLAVRNGAGGLPYDDAVLDFSNPQTVAWYREKIGALLRLGVGAIKVDFGEAAPLDGVYHSGRTGFYEHNLYPLRYNRVVAELTREVTGASIIWARSAWAGSQRYPVHWGGDAAASDVGMAGTLRGGLSLGLSGFTFWSHDMGGFAGPTPEALYRRWVPFGMLTSHSRSHGIPPREPWEFGPAFTDLFRRAAELRYRLLPYIYAQAKDAASRGLPMVRALFVEYPDDPGSWLVEDEYLFGTDLLVAPLVEAGDRRAVYLPPGGWIDYQTGRRYPGGWHTIAPGPLPIVLLVREGAAVPHAALAQSTGELDWTRLELVVFANGAATARGLVYLPDTEAPREVRLERRGGRFRLREDPFAGRVAWTIRLGGRTGRVD